MRFILGERPEVVDFMGFVFIFVNLLSFLIDGVVPDITNVMIILAYLCVRFVAFNEVA